MSAADATPNLVRLCALSGLQTNCKPVFPYLPIKEVFGWMTAQLPFEAYDQNTRKIFRFLAFSALFAADTVGGHGDTTDPATFGAYKRAFEAQLAVNTR